LHNVARGGFTAAPRTFFREREFIVRSQGQVRFIKVSAKLQLIAAAVVVVLTVAWIATMAALIAARFEAAGESSELRAREARTVQAEARVADFARRAQVLERRQAFIEEALRLEAEGETAPTTSVAPVARKLSSLATGAAGMADLEGRQLATIAILTSRAEARADEAETAIRRMGLNPGLMLARSGDRRAQGGPLLAAAGGDPQLKALAAKLARMSALKDALATVPHNAPASLASVSSGFGYRSDPFTGEEALHAGLDFAGPMGAPIYAAANGTVTFAGVKNGYGNCLEISHGNGVVTRYAHMSGFRARAGQSVAAGDVIGAIGNSGRSTGPHLHFEVRINDQAVNPRRFLKAG
jgi:murein DD-endopeptidase MepM/ murein hydrolase activator NlpD